MRSRKMFGFCYTGKKSLCYRIYFMVERQAVVILHVRHAARRPLGDNEETAD